MKTIYLIEIVIFWGILLSCNKEVGNSSIKTMDNLVVPDGFNYTTEKNVTFKVAAFDNTAKPLTKVRFDINAINGNEVLSLGGFATGTDGKIEISRSIASYFDTILFNTGYLGLASNVKIKIDNDIADYNKLQSFSSKFGQQATLANQQVQILVGNSVVRSLSGFDLNGIPSNLESLNDNIDASFLNDINASLPEYKPVPIYHPQYLATSNETDVKLTQDADVWVTFVAEGAGYKNVLGYYKYNLSSPPTSKNSIDSIFVIFPNVSFLNSGGGLVSGNKVKLGRFKANIGIGWVLISDGFRNNTITSGNYLLFSDPRLNPETDPAKQQHNVLLYDAVRSKVLLSFEDVRRDQGSDQDFNDAIFYVTANPVTAIQNTNYPKVSTSAIDTDSDGVPDNLDDYPNDANKAFNNYYPSATGFGSLAFEDLWPSKGDYDMNDMVVDYRFNQITNASNKVVEITGKLVLKAAGASYRNGFGFSLPVASAKVSQASGSKLSSNIITLDNNGLESGNSLATFIAFDDNLTVLPYTGTLGNGVNTTPGATYVKPDTLSVDIKLTAPIDLATLGTPPYNPFIFVNQTRSKEVHLPGYSPTSKANTSLFGTSDDRSLINGSKLYKTSNNLPWAILISGGFDYPVEKVSIINAYLHFGDWAQSGGTLYQDWYKNQNGYRQSVNIYVKP